MFIFAKTYQNHHFYVSNKSCTIYKPFNMKKRRILLTALSSMLFTISFSQITERERPAEWKSLINGGKFMDRFEAMPQGKLSADVWGYKDVVPRFVDNGIESPTISFWGGNIIKGDDGVFNLFVCGWPENSRKGHMFWSNSTTFHATSKSLSGPYKIENSIGKGHNPEAYRLSDGRYLVYVIDGYYIANDPKGPWIYGVFQFNKRGRRIIEGLSNLTFASRQDGSKLMVCRGGGIWISRDGVKEYNLLSDKSTYPPVDGEFEDPIVWKDSIQYHMIVNDWLGRIAFYQRSKDGLHWITEPGEAYMPGITKHQDGTVEKWFKYERMKVFQDEQGRVIQANFAVIDTIKWEDLPGDKHSSKNVCIPMNKGMLLTVLNTKPVTEATKKIDVLIKGENDFNPAKDIDLKSLRFGSYKEVNYGRGFTVSSVKESGNDLIVSFKGKNSGIDSEEFAPKMIGRRKDGKMIFGYAALPFVDYKPAILSATAPVYFKDEKQISVNIDNFGLSASPATDIELLYNDDVIARGTLEPIEPYGCSEISFTTKPEFIPLKSRNFTVRFIRNGKLIDTNNFVIE